MHAVAFWQAWAFTREHVVVYWTFALIMGQAAEAGHQIRLNAVLRVLQNQLFWTQITLWGCLYFHPFGPDPEFSAWDFVFKFPFMLLFEHAAFFFAHRLLHCGWLYRRVHHVHHAWHKPVPYSALDAHAAEHVLVNLGPLLLAPLLCGARLQTVRVWTWVATCNSILAHSGDSLGGEHDMHHRFLTCNFGLHGFFFDKMWGTYRAPVKRTD